LASGVAVVNRYIAALLVAVSLSGRVTGQELRYPAAARDDVVDDFHGARVADPYRWLEELNGARTAEWLEAEKRITSGYLAAIPGREAIRQRLTSLWKYARTDVPWREGGRIFYLHNTGLQAQSALTMQRSLESPPRIVVDPNTLSPDGSIAVRDYAVSPDGRFVAYNTSRGGADMSETHVRRLSDGRDLDDTVPGVLNGVCWTRDGKGFFHVRHGTPKPGSASGPRPPTQVAYHVVGRPPAEDRVIVEWGEARWVYCMLGDGGRYALFVAEKGTESEVFAQDLSDPRRPDHSRPAFLLLSSARGFHTPLDIVGHTLFLRTKFEAPKERVISLDLREGAGARPRTVVPEAADVIETATIAGDRIVLNYLADVKSRLRLFDLNGQPAGEVGLPGIGAVGWPLNGRPSSPDLFYSFASFLTPRTVFRYDLKTRRSVPFRPNRLPFDPAPYETRQIFYASRDGTRVPMFVTASKNLKLDGTHPAMLTAYGGYGSSLPPDYSPDIPMWLERGGVYAVANIRGGGEYGETWHRAGMLEKKQNSFDDFIAAAESLVSLGYTAPGRLAIYGHSNGGLLIGAVITQRPELFAAAVPNAGHYDMLRYHRTPAGAAWVSEYGSPDQPDDFRWLRAYSPLHNVQPGACYPATMLLAADRDDRVVPSHSYKFAAALQSAQGCGRPILLRVAVNSSHGYASRKEQISERTDMWAFVLSRVNGTR
jgi:prolyl oligopeptidase